MSREMKHSGTDWIGEIPVQWELAPTKRVFRGKKRIVGDEADNYERLALTLNGVVKRNKDDNEGLQPEQFSGYQILEKNELVFKLIDLQNIRTSRVGLSPYTGIVSPAYIILSNSETDNRFYYYWFMDMYNRCIFNQMGDDGVRSALNIKDVLEIPLPLIAESTRIKIASFLDKKCAEIDEMIALQEKIVEELKAYKQSVITEAVTKGLNPDVPMKDSGIEWVGEIPEHWEIKRLKQTLSKPLQYGANESGIAYNPNLPRYVRITDILDNSLKEDIDKQSLTEEQAAGYILQHNDILFARSGGTVGKSFIYNECYGRCAFAGYLIKASVNSSMQAKFVYYFTQTSCYDEWKKQIFIQSTIQNIGADRYSQLPLTVPSVKEQEVIVNYLDKRCTEIDNLISIKLSKIDSLKEYKKSIIYEYVTGKKEVIE